MDISNGLMIYRNRQLPNFLGTFWGLPILRPIYGTPKELDLYHQMNKEDFYHENYLFYNRRNMFSTWIRIH